MFYTNVLYIVWCTEKLRSRRIFSFRSSGSKWRNGNYRNVRSLFYMKHNIILDFGTHRYMFFIFLYVLIIDNKYINSTYVATQFRFLLLNVIKFILEMRMYRHFTWQGFCVTEILYWYVIEGCNQWPPEERLAPSWLPHRKFWERS